MRVYEIAKEKGVTSKEILSILKNESINLASHMSIIPPEGILVIEKIFSKPATAKKEKVIVQVDEIKQEKNVEKQVVSQTVKPKVEAITTEIEKEIIKPQVPHITSSKDIIRKSDRALGLDDEEVGFRERSYEDLLSSKIKIKHAIGVQKVKRGSSARKYLARQERAARLDAQIKKDVTEIAIEKNLPLFEAANLMGKTSGDLVLALLKKGMACNRNQVLPADTIAGLAEQFGIKAILKLSKTTSSSDQVSEKVNKGVTRWPIVVVMGHVDHGKTTLLDYIRKMNTAAKEKGGITQHIGAYEVESHHGKIVFLDTPGHEAFSFLRSRGTKITDLAILVVAADDGVKPQTIEAIEHARNANIPIIVAINKIDKVPSDAALQTIKRQLAEKKLVVEDWGGDIICVPISAKTGQGVDELLEMIILQAQMMDLKSDPLLPAKAFILESKVEKGYGPVATVICVEGSLKQGDYFVCGSGVGKVRLLVDSLGQKVSQVGPSIPVKVVGFDNFVEIGDWLNVVPMDVYLKNKGSKNVQISNPLEALTGTSSQIESTEQLNFIIKTDTRGSKEAIDDCMAKLSKKAPKGSFPMFVVHSGIGDISESDVELADATGSIILGLHIKAEKNSLTLAKNEGVKIELFDIIYHMVEFLEALLEKNRKFEKVWNKVGELVVRKVFDIKKVGIVAGCYVREGIISKSNKVVCMRGNRKIAEGKLTSLQREGNHVKEVHAGYECGFVCDSFSDWQEGDIVQTFAQVSQVVK